ncbi:hypothetical protein H0H92_007638 [Tricholoma furcatifolium]|nr:hypothetical protein H0H92_007638 [Tricholoma furcatifolium]
MIPPALLDFPFLRISGNSSSARAASAVLSGSRRASTARHVRRTTPVSPPPPVKSAYKYTGARPRQTELTERRPAPVEKSSLAKRNEQIVQDAGFELQRRVTALGELANAEEVALDPPHYTEDDLMFLYEDLLAMPSEQQETPDMTPEMLQQKQIEEDMMVVCAAEERAIMDESLASSSTLSQSQAYRRLLSYALDAVTRIEAARASLKLSPNVDPSIAKDEYLPSSILSLEEFQAILRLSIHAGDAQAADLTLDIMKRSGLPIPEDMITSLMKVYASAGNVTGTERVLVRYLEGSPTPQQRHFHIKSHLASTPTETIPTSALQLLHSYEAQTLPAPIQTYTSVITSLFSSNSSLGRAHAWDLFSHMRYVAHANPDAALYALMIRACASPVNVRASEPEKALDLWTEMTVDQRITPTAGAYDAIILACARSGKTTYVNEAFRLAKQMLDAHRDARGESAFQPSLRTYCALLEGAKRIGDLPRARWILAQIIGVQTNPEDSVNEEVMTHLFHTYASYRPPFHRSIVKPAEAASSHNSTSESTDVSLAQSQDAPETSSVPTREPSGASFTHIPPQSGTEVIHEIQILYDRVLHDSGIKALSDPTDGGSLPMEKKFDNVKASPRLLNSYLSVFYKHAPFEDACNMYRQVFEECQISRTGRTYVEALERCAIARRGHERTVVMEFADEVWAEWTKLEEAGHDKNGRPLSGRTIEKAHIAMIRVLALTNNIDRAMHHLRAFAAHYPPSDLRTPASKPAMRSTRTVLVGERPLVRMTSGVEVPDDHVPPLIMFDDIEVLHHRLVATRSAANIKYVKWICKSYEGALRARRQAALSMKPGIDEEESLARVAAPSI